MRGIIISTQTPEIGEIFPRQGGTAWAINQVTNLPVIHMHRDGQPTENEIALLNDVGDESFVFITGHGRLGSEVVSGGYITSTGKRSSEQWSLESYVKLIVENGKFSHEDKTKSRPQLNLILWVCEGAYGSTNSPAYKMANLFCEYGIDVNILATTNAIGRFSGNEIVTTNENLTLPYLSENLEDLRVFKTVNNEIIEYKVKSDEIEKEDLLKAGIYFTTKDTGEVEMLLHNVKLHEPPESLIQLRKHPQFRFEKINSKDAKKLLKNENMIIRCIKIHNQFDSFEINYFDNEGKFKRNRFSIDENGAIKIQDSDKKHWVDSKEQNINRFIDSIVPPNVMKLKTNSRFFPYIVKKSEMNNIQKDLFYCDSALSPYFLNPISFLEDNDLACNNNRYYFSLSYIDVSYKVKSKVFSINKDNKIYEAIMDEDYHRIVGWDESSEMTADEIIESTIPQSLLELMQQPNFKRKEITNEISTILSNGEDIILNLFQRSEHDRPQGGNGYYFNVSIPVSENHRTMKQVFFIDENLVIFQAKWSSSGKIMGWQESIYKNLNELIKNISMPALPQLKLLKDHDLFKESIRTKEIKGLLKKQALKKEQSVNLIIRPSSLNPKSVYNPIPYNFEFHYLNEKGNHIKKSYRIEEDGTIKKRGNNKFGYIWNDIKEESIEELIESIVVEINNHKDSLSVFYSQRDILVGINAFKCISSNQARTKLESAEAHIIARPSGFNNVSSSIPYYFCVNYFHGENIINDLYRINETGTIQHGTRKLSSSGKQLLPDTWNDIEHSNAEELIESIGLTITRKREATTIPVNDKQLVQSMKQGIKKFLNLGHSRLRMFCSISQNDFETKKAEYYQQLISSFDANQEQQLLVCYALLNSNEDSDLQNEVMKELLWADNKEDVLAEIGQDLWSLYKVAVNSDEIKEFILDVQKNANLTQNDDDSNILFHT